MLNEVKTLNCKIFIASFSNKWYIEIRDICCVEVLKAEMTIYICVCVHACKVRN
jgi:hypothetical protein